MQLLRIWTVYGTSTADYHGQYVAREFSGGEPTSTFFANVDLQTVYDWIKERASMVNQGVPYRMERDINDDPVILESWV